MKYTYLLLVTFLTANVQINPAESMFFEPAHLVTLKFVNQTGHDVDITPKYFKEHKNGIPMTILKEKNSVSNFSSLQFQNLDKIKEYSVNFTRGRWSGYTNPELKITSSDIKSKLGGEYEATIIIKPSYVPYTNYVNGFAQPEINVLNRKTSSNKEFEEWVVVGKDEDAIFSELGIKERSVKPYMIFGLNKPPKAIEGKSYNEQPEEVYKYLKNLEERKSKLIENWPDSIAIDQKMKQKYNVDRFSIKMRNAIESAYQQLLGFIGA